MMVMSSNPDLQEYHETFARYANDQPDSIKEKPNFDAAVTRRLSIEHRLKVSKIRRAITKRNNEIQRVEPYISGAAKPRDESMCLSNGVLPDQHISQSVLNSPAFTLMSPNSVWSPPEVPSPHALPDLGPWLSSDLILSSQSSPIESSSSLPSPSAVAALTSLLASGLPAPSLMFLGSLLSPGLAALSSPELPSPPSSATSSLEWLTSPSFKFGPFVSSCSPSSTSGESSSRPEESAKPFVSDYQQRCLRASDCLWPKADLVRNKVRPPPKAKEVRVPFMTEDYPWGRFEQLEEIRQHLLRSVSNDASNVGKTESCQVSKDKCNLCRLYVETLEFAHTHQLRSPTTGEVTCPILFRHVCQICGATGKVAHTQNNCPRNHENRHVATIEATSNNSNVLERQPYA